MPMSNRAFPNPDLKNRNGKMPKISCLRGQEQKKP